MELQKYGVCKKCQKIQYKYAESPFLIFKEIEICRSCQEQEKLTSLSYYDANNRLKYSFLAQPEASKETFQKYKGKFGWLIFRILALKKERGVYYYSNIPNSKYGLQRITIFSEENIQFWFYAGSNSRAILKISEKELLNNINLIRKIIDKSN